MKKGIILPLIFSVLLISSCSNKNEKFDDKNNNELNEDKYINEINSIQMKIGNFLESCALKGKNSKPKKSNSISLNNTKTPKVVFAEASEGLNIIVDDNFVNPYSIVDKNQVYDFGYVFASLEMLKLTKNNTNNYNGKTIRLYESNDTYPYYLRVRTFNNLDDIIFLGGILYSLSFDDYFMLSCSNEYVEYQDMHCSIKCSGDFSKIDNRNNLYLEAEKINKPNFKKEFLEKAFLVSDDINNAKEEEYINIHLEESEDFNSYNCLNNIALQFICQKYYYTDKTGLSFDNYDYASAEPPFLNVYDNENNYLINNAHSMGALGFCYIPNGVTNLNIDENGFECINIPNTITSISAINDDYSFIQYAFIDKKCSIGKEIEDKIKTMNPDAKIYFSSDYYMSEGVYIPKKNFNK